MATYRKRTPPVEAIQITATLPPADLHAFLGTLKNVRTLDDGIMRGIIISTPEGDLPVPEYNWILKTKDGRLSATDPASFAAGYELVQEQTNGN